MRRSATNRSAITNGNRQFALGGDGRGAWVRRWRDLAELHMIDRGGENFLSESQKKKFWNRDCCCSIVLWWRVGRSKSMRLIGSWRNRKSCMGRSRNGRNSGFYGPDGRELTAIWPIQDSLGIVAKGQLRFALRPIRMHCPSVSLLYGGRAIYRVDIEELSVNPIHIGRKALD
jgi:hypothetical protein